MPGRNAAAEAKYGVSPGANGGTAVAPRQASTADLDKFLQENYNGLTSADLARMPPEWQASLISRLPADKRAGVTGAIQQQRADAFRAGEVLPGVSPNGEGIDGKYLSGEAKALGIQARAQNRVESVADSASQNPEDYTAHATQDQGPGYDLVDRMSQLGQAIPLDQQLQLDAIKQGRTDTTGADAQAGALKGYQDIYAQGGLTAVDRARIAQSQQIRGAEARGAEGAIRANAEEQGRAGGRMSFLLSQQAQQRSTNQRAMDDLQTEALAQGRRERALQGQADVGGSIQTSQDLIDQFNTKDARDVRDAANEARGETWREGNRRDSVNTGTKNSAATVQYGADVARSGQNTDRVNQAEFVNKSQTGGQRGLFRDKLAGAEAAAGQENAGAALRGGQEIQEDALNAHKYDATVGAITGAAGLVGDVATAGLTETLKKKPAGG